MNSANRFFSTLCLQRKVYLFIFSCNTSKLAAYHTITVLRDTVTVSALTVTLLYCINMSKGQHHSSEPHRSGRKAVESMTSRLEALKSLVFLVIIAET